MKLDVKSTITYALVFAYILFIGYAMYTGAEMNDGFTQTVSTIIAFYFGTQAMKKVE